MTLAPQIFSPKKFADTEKVRSRVEHIENLYSMVSIALHWA
jgi:hypothetical protein